MRYMVKRIFDAANAANNANGEAIDTSNVYQMSVFVNATGTPTASVKIQVSNQIVEPGLDPTQWVDLASATVTVNSATNFLIPKNDICYLWTRLVLTGGGTGTVTATVKTIGW